MSPFRTWWCQVCRGDVKYVVVMSIVSWWCQVCHGDVRCAVVMSGESWYCQECETCNLMFYLSLVLMARSWHSVLCLDNGHSLVVLLATSLNILCCAVTPKQSTLPSQYDRGQFLNCIHFFSCLKTSLVFVELNEIFGVNTVEFLWTTIVQYFYIIFFFSNQITCYFLKCYIF